LLIGESLIREADFGAKLDKLRGAEPRSSRHLCVSVCTQSTSLAV
jgi:hypothetical protein